MELQIIGKNLELSETVRSYVQKKLGRLTRHLPSIVDIKVEISEERTKSPEHRFVVQVTINSKGTLLRGEERQRDIYAAIDSVANVMNRQLERYKGKLYKKGRGVSLARSGPIPELPEQESLPQVVKVKRFTVKPMSVEEAVEQMELLGHSFFLFTNADSDQVGLLYLRADGDYGLIEPELS